MCGILGSVDIAFKDSLLDSLRHRGPDGQSTTTLNCHGREVSLGHTRLSILDLSNAGHQPMQSRDGRWWLTFNGEIYNHLDLRSRLLPPFRGHSDTETLVELLAAEGISRTLQVLNGMFAFAALDIAEGKLYLARDPFGIKPLYYAIEDSGLAFASEVRVLRQMGFADSIGEAGLRQFLTLRYIPSPSTLWEGTHRLPPGHVLSFDLESGRDETVCYIESVKDRYSGSMDDATAEYKDRLRAAVGRQLLSDVPVGVLLSGGVDSALVAAMAKDCGADLPCYTVGFGSAYRECEIEDARLTARVLKLPFNQITISHDELMRALPLIARSVEEPLGTTSIMPMWHLVHRAREDVTVVLTGQGSDEPWGGYFRYQAELLREHIPLSALWRLGRSVSGFWRGRPDFIERGLRTLAETDVVSQIVEACTLFSSEERLILLGDANDGGARDQVAFWQSWAESGNQLSSAERMMRVDTRMNLPDDLLLYGDKISMATSLEARVPMLDIELVRFVDSLPIDYRLRWRQGKVVHKRTAEASLPAEIVHRPKKGFQVPFGELSRGPWREWVEQSLLQGLADILDVDGVAKLWHGHLAMKPDRSRQIFALLMLSLCRQEHLR